MATYQDAGVDIQLGDQASKILYEAARQTWENRKGRLGELLVPFDDFSGLRAIDVSELPQGSFMNMGFDGVGTKIEIAERVGDHRTIAHDLFAMVCDDAVIRGAEPILIGSILDVNRLKTNDSSHIDKIKQLAEGYISAANIANVAVVNGELAELGSRVQGFGTFQYNWGASVVWFARRERMINGDHVQEGDTIIGLHESGFRSNGLSLARSALTDIYGPSWHEKTFLKENIGQILLQPSEIYTPAIVDLTGGFTKQPKATLHTAAHITGGGIPGKLGRALKTSKLGAKLDRLFSPNSLMLHLQEKAHITDEEAYRTWNMGQGMILVTPEPKRVLKTLEKHSLKAQIIGTIQSSPNIDIKSKAFNKKDQWIQFPINE